MNLNESGAPEANSVILHTDYIEIIWRGEQSVDKMRTTNLEALAAAEKLRAYHKPILASLIIVNHPDMPNMTALAELLIVFQTMPFDRLAVSGDIPKTMMPLIKTVISTYNRQMEINYKEETADAVTWLKGNDKGNRDV